MTRLSVLLLALFGVSCPANAPSPEPVESDLFSNMVVGKPFRSGPWVCVWETKWSGICDRPVETREEPPLFTKADEALFRRMDMQRLLAFCRVATGDQKQLICQDMGMPLDCEPCPR